MSSMANRFEPYDEASQPARKVEGYKETFVRVPSQPAYKRPASFFQWRPLSSLYT